MAIITEEPNSPQPRLRKSKPKPDTTKPTSDPQKPPQTTTKSTATNNPFQFWFYFTIIVSLVTLFFILISSLTPQDQKTWFLNLPPNLRQHYSKGRTIKVQTKPNSPQIEIFSIQQGPAKSNNNVLIVHGLGCSSFSFRKTVEILGRKDNTRAVAIDLPGSGFSDKSILTVEEKVRGNSLFDVYEQIKEKGLFWGFDQLVEQGYIEQEPQFSKQETLKPIELGSEEIGRVLTQVVDSMGLSKVNLVLHDSAFVLSANWISKNLDLVNSVVILDGSTKGAAFPGWVLEAPFVLGFRFVFEQVVKKCCVRSGNGFEVDAHRILLNGLGGSKAVVDMGTRMNLSFDLSEWSNEVKEIPIRVIWSSEWISEGRKVADLIPQAKFVTHSGGRWIQEHNAEEVAESIYEFVSSLPKSTEQVVDEPTPEHVKKMFGEDKNSHDHGHGGHDHHDGHGHAHAGYMDAYGLDHGWAA